MNVNKAFEAENGFIVDTEDDTGPFYTGGSASPVGLDLPTRTIYVQTNASSKVLIWQKFGASLNDWRQLSAEDIPYDPTGDLNLDPSDTDLDAAVRRMANASIADIAEIEGFISNNQETTTSNGWVSKSGFPFTTVSTKTAGQFSIRWFTEVGQTKATRNFGFRIRWRPTGGTFTNLSEIATMELPGDNNTVQQSGFKQVTLPTNNTIEIDIQHGQTTSGFSSIISNVSVEVRRISD